MYKITNLDTLGSEYYISDMEGKILDYIQIITAKEIINAGIGYFEDSNLSIQEYLDQSRKHFSGYKNINPYSTLCWISKTSDYDITEIIEYAIKYDYKKVIIEIPD